MFEIDSNIDASKINILCTHSVPDERLNLHMDIITKVGFDSPFNAYSGVKSYLNALNGRVKYSFSGHTHKRVTATIDGVECYNCGNDYQPPYSFFTIEV